MVGALVIGEVYPNYKDFSSVPPENMKWHDVVGARWRHWGHIHPYLQGGLGLAGTSAMSGGVFLGMQALSNKLLNPGPDAELVKANQQLGANLGEVTNRLHQEVGKSALAADVLVNAVHTGDVPAAIVEEAKAIKESKTVEELNKKIVMKSPSQKLQVTTTPVPRRSTVTTVTPAPESPKSTATGSDLPDSIWDLRGPYLDKETQTPNERTLIVPDDRTAHHQLYQRFGRAIYDPWWRPPEHLKVTDPYHFRLGLITPAILASLEQEHPPAARYPLQHEYDRAHGPRGYNPYLIIPKNERDGLMMQSVEDGQVNLAKYGQLLEDAALRYQLDHTKGKKCTFGYRASGGSKSVYRSVRALGQAAESGRRGSWCSGFCDRCNSSKTWNLGGRRPTPTGNAETRHGQHRVAMETIADPEEPETTSP